MAARQSVRHVCAFLAQKLSNSGGNGGPILQSVCVHRGVAVRSLYRSEFSSSAAEQAPTSESNGLKHTVLNAFHLDRGAKMVPFAGYSMPIQYSGDSIPESSVFCRSSAGLFDVSHMCGVSITGPDAIRYMHKVRTNDHIHLHLDRIHTHSERENVRTIILIEYTCRDRHRDRQRERENIYTKY